MSVKATDFLILNCCLSEYFKIKKNISIRAATLAFSVAKATLEIAGLGH